MTILTKKNERDYLKISSPILAAVPCLTTPDEQKYLYWLTKGAYQGRGAVVEIGTWFGCSAGFLAAGLRDAKKNNELFCFDRFTFSSSEKARVHEQGFHFENLVIDADTTTTVQKHVREIYDNCRLIKTDIDKIVWDNGPIEILHLDAPKRASDILHVLKIFRPYFIPGESVVVAQDFCVPRAYALPLVFGALADSFELVHVPSSESTTVTFKYVAPYVIDERLDINRWQISRALDTIQQFFPRLNEQQQRMLMIGLAFFCYDVGDEEMAEEIIKSF